MALGAETVAIRNTPLMLSFLESYKHADGAISLIAGDSICSRKITKRRAFS